MTCPDCGKLRHEGPCEADELEILAMDAEAARERYEGALKERNDERASQN